MNNFKKRIKIILTIMIILCCICGMMIYILTISKSDVGESKTALEGDEVIEYEAQKLKDPIKFLSVQLCIRNNIDQSFVAKDMNILEGETVFNYSVYGTVGTGKEVYFIVRVDIENMTFLIEEIDNKNSIDNINLETTIETIDNNGKNTFEYISKTSQEICQMYLEQFAKLEIEDTETAYSLLDKEYRKERFPTFEDYKEYIKEYQETIKDSTLAKYSVKYVKDNPVYKLVDTYNNIYTLETTSVMKYTIKLDDYTIKSDDYKEKYNKLSNKDKVQANVYMFLQMINTKDYVHAYAVLDNNFKNSNFDTLAKFKEYVRKNFFYYNLDVSGISVQEEGNYYVYRTTIQSDGSSAAETKNLAIIMRLEEETDFVMSFDIE